MTGGPRTCANDPSWCPRPGARHASSDPSKNGERADSGPCTEGTTRSRCDKHRLPSGILLKHRACGWAMTHLTKNEPWRDLSVVPGVRCTFYPRFTQTGLNQMGADTDKNRQSGKWYQTLHSCTATGTIVQLTCWSVSSCWERILQVKFDLALTPSLSPRVHGPNSKVRLV